MNLKEYRGDIMNDILKRLTKEGVKFYSDNLIHWFVDVTLTRKPYNDIKNKLGSALLMTPVGNYSVECEQSDEIIELSTEVWSTSCNKEFLEQVLNLLDYDLHQEFSEYSISISSDDVDYEYVGLDDINDDEYDSIYRCLEYETSYYIKKELKEGNTDGNSKTN